MKLSVVTTLYYSAAYVTEFYNRVCLVAEKVFDEFELIFVNDGSPDSSLEIAKSLLKNDRRITIVDLSRNFGHHKAAMTGLSYACGDYVFLIDCDLEEEPELLEEFWRVLNEENDVDLVFGVQRSRKGALVEKLAGWVFFKIFNFLSEYKIPENLVMARLMTRRYVRQLLRHKEAHPVFSGLSVLTGFKQKALYVVKGHRPQTSYTLVRRMNMLTNSITSLAVKPLVCVFYIGIITLLVSAIMILNLIHRRMFHGIVEGWTSVVVSIWFLGGLTIFCIGLVGMYLSKVFEQVKNRPYVIVKDIYRADSK